MTFLFAQLGWPQQLLESRVGEIFVKQKAIKLHSNSILSNWRRFSSTLNCCIVKSLRDSTRIDSDDDVSETSNNGRSLNNFGLNGVSWLAILISWTFPIFRLPLHHNRVVIMRRWLSPIQEIYTESRLTMEARFACEISSTTLSDAHILELALRLSLRRFSAQEIHVLCMRRLSWFLFQHRRVIRTSFGASSCAECGRSGWVCLVLSVVFANKYLNEFAVLDDVQEMWTNQFDCIRRAHTCWSKDSDCLITTLERLSHRSAFIWWRQIALIKQTLNSQLQAEKQSTVDDDVTSWRWILN